MSAFVEKVAQKLGISREAASDRVREFVDDILSAADGDSQVHVEGLGTFTAGSDGVQFAPDPRLATVVNHRFVGLAPISVESVGETGHLDESSFALPDIPIAAPHDANSRSESAAVEGKSEDVSDSHHDYGHDIPGEHGVDPGGVSTVGPDDLAEQAIERAAEAKEAAGHEIPDAETPEREVWGDAAEGPGDKDYADAAPPASVVEGITEAKSGGTESAAAELDFDGPVGPGEGTDRDDAIDADETEAAEPADADVAEPGPMMSDQPPPAVVKRKSRALFYFGMIVILLLAIAGVLYLISLGDGPPSDPQDELVEGPAGASSPGGSESGTKTPAEAVPPLISWKPGALDRRAGGYTLIVSSQETVDEANAIALELSRRLADEDLPIDVLRGAARGQTWYRVAIGQFSRQSIATREQRRLAERLPEGAWVLRIRTNM